MEYKNMEEEIAHLLSIDPDYAPALNNCGKFLARQGKSAEATVFFHEASKLSPQPTA
jgi:Tfp pilus assembly protein PilF